MLGLALTELYICMSNNSYASFTRLFVVSEALDIALLNYYRETKWEDMAEAVACIQGLLEAIYKLNGSE